MSESKYRFVLSKIIMERNTFTGAIVYAAQRQGKTSYAMQVSRELYGNWDDVFKNMFYKIEDILEYLTHQLDNNNTLPVILWDDAGVHGSKFKYFTNKSQAAYLQSLFDVLGTATRSIIMTTPNPMNLLKSLREYEFLKIKITKANSNGDRIAKGYGVNLMPSGTTKVFRSFEDHYNTRLPDDVYQRYAPIRKSYYIEALQNLKEDIAKHSLPIAKDGLEDGD